MCSLKTSSYVLIGVIGSPLLACQEGYSEESSLSSDSYATSISNDCMVMTEDSIEEQIEIPPGSIVITEIMLRPLDDGIRANKKQWVELWNASNVDISLQGWKLETSFLGNVLQEEIQCQIAIPAQTYLVLGGSIDQEINAHVPVRYEWHNKDFELDPFSDSNLRILTPSGLEVDQVMWEVAQWPIKDGHTTSLDARKVDSALNDEYEHWCLGSHVWADSHGNKGTPGKENQLCELEDLRSR